MTKQIFIRKNAAYTLYRPPETSNYSNKMVERGKLYANTASAKPVNKTGTQGFGIPQHWVLKLKDEDGNIIEGVGMMPVKYRRGSNTWRKNNGRK